MLIHEQDHSKDLYRIFKTNLVSTNYLRDFVVGEDKILYVFGETVVESGVLVEGELVCLS